MECKHFGTCGSCTLYELSYTHQLEQKKLEVSGLLNSLYDKTIDVFESPRDHYRARAEFRIWHEGEKCNYAMSRLGEKGIVLIDECLKVIKPIEKRMWHLLESIGNSSLLKERLFAVEFLATTTDELLITMLYHKKLDQNWEQEASQLQTKLDCKIIGRSHKQKIVPSHEYVIEKLSIDNREIIYKEYESGFTQPNPLVNIQMIEWAIKHAKTIKSGDLLESYCGLGNFTLPLSFYFDKVLATEISKRSIMSAQENCILNNRDNIEFVRLSSEEMTQALNNTRKFNRLEKCDLQSYNFSTVLVDPPRAGLDSDTITLIANIEHIIYISCNPHTLARDLGILTQTHSIQDVAIFDQFPFTSHIESGVYLIKNN